MDQHRSRLATDRPEVNHMIALALRDADQLMELKSMRPSEIFRGNT